MLNLEDSLFLNQGYKKIFIIAKLKFSFAFYIFVAGLKKIL